MPSMAAGARAAPPQRQSTLLSFFTAATAAASAAAPSASPSSTRLASPAKAAAPSPPHTEGTGGCSSASDATPPTPAAARRRSRSDGGHAARAGRHDVRHAGDDAIADGDDDDLRLADFLFAPERRTAETRAGEHRASPPRTATRDPFLSATPPSSASPPPPPPPPPSLPLRPQPLTQTTLDLGQMHPGHMTQCPRCRMRYTAASAEDTALHRRFCRAERQRLRRRQRLGGDWSRDACLDVSVARTPTSASSTTLGSEASSTSTAAAAAAFTHAAHLLAAIADADVSRGVGCHRGAGRQRSTKAARQSSFESCSGGGVGGGGVDLVEPFTCTRVPALAGPQTRASGSGVALEVFHLRIDASRLANEGVAAATTAGGTASSAAASTATARVARVTTLLEGLGFAPAILFAAAASGASRAAPVAHSGAAAVHVVCVVDGLLQRLLAAVAGEARVREQDPELCLDERLDGSTVCSTQRHFTQGDVTGLWTCTPAELHAAQAAWEKTTVAPFASARQTLETFFAKRSTTTSSSCAMDTATPSAPSPSTAAHATAGVLDAVQQAEARCQQALATALHGLAQHLVYGRPLWPATEFSFAHAALAAPSSPGRDAVEGALTRLAACGTTAVPRARQDLSQAFSLYTHEDDADLDDECDMQERAESAPRRWRASGARASSEDGASGVRPLT